MPVKILVPTFKDIIDPETSLIRTEYVITVDFEDGSPPVAICKRFSQVKEFHKKLENLYKTLRITPPRSMWRCVTSVQKEERRTDIHRYLQQVHVIRCCVDHLRDWLGLTKPLPVGVPASSNFSSQASSSNSISLQASSNSTDSSFSSVHSKGGSEKSLPSPPSSKPRILGMAPQPQNSRTSESSTSSITKAGKKPPPPSGRPRGSHTHSPAVSPTNSASTSPKLSPRMSPPESPPLPSRFMSSQSLKHVRIPSKDLGNDTKPAIPALPTKGHHRRTSSLSKNCVVTGCGEVRVTRRGYCLNHNPNLPGNATSPHPDSSKLNSSSPRRPCNPTNAPPVLPAKNPLHPLHSTTSRTPVVAKEPESTGARDWGVDQVQTFLKGIGLSDETILGEFQANLINGQVLLSLSEEELETELGLTKKLLRRRVVGEIDKLRSND